MPCDDDNEVRKGDCVRLRVQITEEVDGVEVGVDITAAVTLQILLKPPASGTLKTKTATLDSDAVNGWMYYDCVTADLDVLGQWKVQGYVDMGSSVTFHSKLGYLSVKQVLT